MIDIGDVGELVPVFLAERNSQLPLHLPLLLSRGQFEVLLVPRTISLKSGALPWKVIEDVPFHEVKPGIWARRVYVKEVNLDGSFAWIVSNQQGDVLWAESAPLGYEPYSSLFESVPDTATAAAAGDPTAIAKLLDWDPTRLTLPIDIIAESQVSAYIDAMYEPASLAPVMPMEASSPDPCDNFPKILHVSIPENDMVDITVQHPSGYSGNIRLMMAKIRY